MLRPSAILLTAAGLALAAIPGFAQTIQAPGRAEPAAKHRKASKPRQALTPIAHPAAGSINAPSTDFTKIERADEEPRSADGPSLHPAMGAGGMGLGGAF